jgi:prepilin-type N-terminal cleavage/methylation domain-containing protein
VKKCVSAVVRGCGSGFLAGGGFVALRRLRRTFAPPYARTGFTLVELMVVLAILGVMAGVAGLAARSLDDTDPAAERAALIADARRRALQTRRPVRLQVASGDTVRLMLALPDGSVRADSALGLDPLTGRPRALP